MVETNYLLIEKLFTNDISVFVHDDKEYILIVDDRNYILNFNINEVEDDTVDRLISNNFKKENCLEKINVLAVDKYYTALVDKLKNELRLLKFSISGIRIYNKPINFAELLKRNSVHKTIPDIEKFYFFDKKFLVDKIESTEDEEKELYSIILNEYNKLKKLCNNIEAISKKIKSRYAYGTIDNLYVINASDVNELIKDIKNINNLKRNIDTKVLDKMIAIMYDNFIIKLNDVLMRHEVFNNTDVERFKTKVKNDIADGSCIIKSIKITQLLILEFSYEFFDDDDNIKKIKLVNFDKEIKEYIEEIERLKSKFNE